jgi:DNA invertase Pin-like site-specific DNA recombinase
MKIVKIPKIIMSAVVAMFTRIDRLARSVGDLVGIVDAIGAKGATLRATEQPIDPSSAAGKAFLQMLGVFAEFDHAIRKERQMEGVAKARVAGVYRGRKPSVAVDDVRRLHADGKSPPDIARSLAIGRTSVYRALGLKAG